ncbi:hypothetical protein EDB84DRAFT_338491 [Lactarius hengduanensis]|nr:hypothetical protein EDB84DRAFT_338491 [Lactarius hengduanensis]
MAAARDLEHGQMSSNSRGPSSSRHPGRGRFNPRQEPPLDSPRDAEPQGGPSQLRVDVTVLRADNVPRLKNVFGLKFFVTVASQAIEKKTPSVPAKRRTARWGESLGAFILQPSTPLILRLYAGRFARRDILIGTHEITPVESKIDTPFVLTNGDGQAGEPVTLYLTVIVSPNTTSDPIMPIDAPIIQSTTINDPPSGEAEEPSVAHESTNPTRSTITTGSETLSPPTDRLPSEMSTSMPAADRRGVSSAESALHSADEAMETRINVSNKWEGALGRIKWVMDTVSPVAELHPYAKMAYGLLFAIPKALLEQFQRDDNIGTLLVAMHDAFDFANQEDRFKAIRRDSRQAQILTLMLQHVCNCCDFILSYAKDSVLWKRILKSAGSQVDKKIEDFRATLLEHRKAFLDEASITTEITALQILDDVGIVASQLDGMATQLKWVSSQVSDAELDAKIREIPYGTGSRFIPDKGCLTGTRTAFLDFIDNWVNDPASERCLVLFGQAGTGKSSIAHEIARRFDKIHRLTSSFIFLRTEQSKPHHLFTTLARDLSDRYPSFKAALGRVVKDNSSLRTGTRDYATLFGSLILDPLKDLHIVGPILVVIDALDESGDVTSKNGLHKFLADAISRLPSNFRVLITSRPEHAIESAFVGGVKIKYMNDTKLAATTYNDILAFLQNELPPDVFNTYGDGLTNRAEGSFQWAAVACGYILNPPDVFGLSKINCINHLLKLTPDRRGQDPLDELYKEVLEGYFTHENSRLLFRSVVGQLIASFEPLSIRSLITLRHASDHASDGDAVVTLLRRLGSLLRNVNSSDENLPIIPLHTSFRDFLTTKEKSDDFWVDLRDAHHQLTHTCLDLLLKELKFNICNLETSYLANKDVTDLSSRVDKHIPPALLYACRFWDDHMEHIDFESDLFGKLGSFFSKKLLFWLEAFSLTTDLRLASAACAVVNTWLASGQAGNQGQVSQTELEKLRLFVNDASIFIRYFGMAMAKSAPHVYLSALPFAPSGSPVSARYSGSFPRILRVERGRLSHWPSLEMVIPTSEDVVLSISISPDGQRIVSGTSDGTICVWNATTGETEAGLFTGHTDSVFLWDSRQMATASSQARAMEQLCGTRPRERQRRAHLPVTLIRSSLWHSRQMMASASSQSRTMEQFVCGTPPRETRRQAHLLVTRIRSAKSSLWDSHQMASASSQALPVEQFVCGTPPRERQRQAHLPVTRPGSSL